MPKRIDNRQSGLISLNSNLQEYKQEKEQKENDFSLANIQDDYLSFKQEYDKFQIKALETKRKKAYMITFSDVPSLCYISFESSKDKAKGVAVMYFRDFHPDFKDDLWQQRFLHAKRKRIPSFDRYADIGRVPVLELLKRGMSFSCGACGKDNFTYGDIQTGRGFIVEDGFEMNPFTKGFILCYHCYKKFFRKN